MRNAALFFWGLTVVSVVALLPVGLLAGDGWLVVPGMTAVCSAWAACFCTPAGGAVRTDGSGIGIEADAPQLARVQAATERRQRGGQR